MENQIIESLPVEVAEIAKNVSAEKQSEVKAVLNQIFSGVSTMRTQLDTIKVVDQNDEASMKLSKVVRLNIKNERLKFEKIFDAKRDEVQREMLSFKTEDQLWLKAKQTMQILTKELEEIAKYKEETKDRFDREQKELKIQERMLKVQKIKPEMSRAEFEHMSDDTFDIFFNGIEQAQIAFIKAEKEAKEEEERLAKIENLQKERNNKALPYYEFWSEFEKTLNFGEQSQVDFDNFMKRLVSEKQKKDEEVRLQEIENARLKAESEKREKEIEVERKRVEVEREKERKEAEAKQKAIEDQARIEREKAVAIAKAEAEKRAKLEAELQGKKEAEAKAEQAKKDAEIQAKKEADKLAKAPIKEKMSIWIDSFKPNDLDTKGFSNEQIDLVDEIIGKFGGFKKWAKGEIDKL